MWRGTGRRGFLRLAGAAPLAVAAVRPAEAAAFEVSSQLYRLRVEPVATGLSHPWGLAFLPDGSFLVPERAGRLRRVRADGRVDSQPVAGTPPVVAVGQGGLLDIRLHPAFASNGWVYLTYAAGRPGASYTALGRGTWSGNALSGFAPIYGRRPALRGTVHYGSRVTFDHAGHLFLSIGDRGDMARAQRRAENVGKVIRLTEDGGVPGDNPFVGRGDTAPEIYALGIRSPQGLHFDRFTGRLWECEHGPMGGDELNLIRSGRNYGWPTISHGRDYDGSPIGVGTSRPGLEQPQRYWTPSIAPSGLTVYRRRLFPRWDGHLFMGALRGERLVRMTVDEAGRVTGEERLLTGRIGRIRTVEAGPNGSLYVLTDEDPGGLWRIRPA